MQLTDIANPSCTEFRLAAIFAYTKVQFCKHVHSAHPYQPMTWFHVQFLDEIIPCNNCTRNHVLTVRGPVCYAGHTFCLGSCVLSELLKFTIDLQLILNIISILWNVEQIIHLLKIKSVSRGCESLSRRFLEWHCRCPCFVTVLEWTDEVPSSSPWPSRSHAV